MALTRDRHHLCRIHMARVLPLLMRGITSTAPALCVPAFDALMTVITPLFNSFLRGGTDDDVDDDDDVVDEQEEDPYVHHIMELPDDHDYSSELQAQFNTSLLVVAEIFPVFPEVCVYLVCVSVCACERVCV